MKIYAALLSIHDFFHFASKDYGGGVTEKVIHNTALMYSLNRHIPTLQRVASGNIPHYEEDLERFQIYSTPAQLSTNEAVLGLQKIDWHIFGGMIKITYNSVDSPLVFSMEGPSFLREVSPSLKEAVPKMGSYLKLPPLSNFNFFTIGGKGPNIVRIGKKLPAARVSYTEVKDVVEKTGRFKASHLINLLDLPYSTKLRSGTIIRIPPSPITMAAELEGAYLEGCIGNKKVFIAKPSIERFSGVFK